MRVIWDKTEPLQESGSRNKVRQIEVTADLYALNASARGIGPEVGIWSDKLRSQTRIIGINQQFDVAPEGILLQEVFQTLGEIRHGEGVSLMRSEVIFPGDIKIRRCLLD